MKKITTGALLVGLACLAAAFGAGFAIYLRPAQATRNAAGTYALPTPGVPFQSNQVISSTQINNTLNDIASTLTDSADRNGKGGFLASVRGVDGTLAAPAFSYTSETGSGYFRNAAGDVRMSILGALVGQWTANGLRVASGVVATPGLSFTAETGTGWYRNAAGDIRFAVSGVDKQFLSATGLGIGVAPTQLLHVLKTATSGATAAADTIGEFESSASHTLALLGANANYEGIRFGDVAAASRGGIFYFNSTHASADQMQFNTGSALRATISNSGLTIGSGGTAISASIRGTASLTGTSIAAGSIQTISITVTGAAVGAECSVGFSANQSLSLIPSCRVTSINTCAFYFANYTTGAISSLSDTISCRVTNP